MKSSTRHLAPSTLRVVASMAVFTAFLCGCAFDKLRLSIDQGRTDFAVVTNLTHGLKTMPPIP